MKKTLFICLLFLFPFRLYAIVSPERGDSVYTYDYIYSISITEPYRALSLLDEAEQQKRMPVHRIDLLRGLTYMNGLNMYRVALSYSQKAYQSDSVKFDEPEYLQLTKLIAEQYDIIGNYTQSIRYAIRAIELAQKADNKRLEADMLLCMGESKRKMGLKAEAEEYIMRSIEIQEQMDKDRRWEDIDALLYAYGVKIMNAQDDGDYQKAIDMLPRYEKVMKQLEQQPDLPEGVCDMRYANGYAAFAYTYAKMGDMSRAAEFYQKYLNTRYALTPDGEAMRVRYLLATRRYGEALKYAEREVEMYAHSKEDTISYGYINYTLIGLAEAYAGLGNHKKEADVYRRIYVLTDSLNAREKNGVALELATIYETHEREAQLQQRTATLKARNMQFSFLIGIVLLLTLLLWRSVWHMRIVKYKNKAMMNTIHELMTYKGELRLLKKEVENSLPAIDNEETLSSGDEEDAAITRPDDGSDEKSRIENERLFHRLDNLVVSHKHYLDSNASRDSLMKLVGVSKNRLAQIIQQCANTNVTGYINGLRLEEAVRIIEINPHYKVEVIAAECGIPNVSTFYRLFRERYGMTPAEYRTSAMAGKNKNAKLLDRN